VKLGTDKAAIFEAHKMVLEDQSYLSYDRMREVSEGALNFSTAEEIKSYFDSELANPM